MLEKLIQKIAEDSISTQSALNQAKIIASKIKNEDFKQWINYELKGYPSGYLNQLPNYRKFRVQIRADIVDEFGITSNDVMMVLDDWAKALNIDDPYNHYERHDIAQIEYTVENAPGNFVINPFQEQLIRMMSKTYAKQYPGYQITMMGRHIALSNLRNVLIQAKQRLFDTLLELKEQFPNLDDGFNPTQENKTKADSIVNFHIYGGTANTNLGIGNTVTQHDITFNSQVQTAFEKLKELGVSNEDIEDAKEIVRTTPKEGIGKKLMHWVGSISQRLIEKGLQDKLPEIIDTVQAIF